MDVLTLIASSAAALFAGLAWWGSRHREPWELAHVSGKRWVLRRTGFGKARLLSVDAMGAALTWYDESGLTEVRAKRGWALVMDIDIIDPNAGFMVSWIPVPSRWMPFRRNKERWWVRQIIA